MGYLDNAGLSYFWGKLKEIFAYKTDIPAASNMTPANLGTAAAGSSTAWARADHVHAKPAASTTYSSTSTEAISGKGVAAALNNYVQKQIFGNGNTYYSVITHDGSTVILRVKEEEINTQLYLTEYNATLSAYSTLTLTGAKTIINNVIAPTSSSDAANKKYVDDSISSLSIPSTPSDIGAAPASAAVPSGGSTGQVLSKVSGTDYDVAWTTVSGGGGSVDYFTISSGMLCIVYEET